MIKCILGFRHYIMVDTNGTLWIIIHWNILHVDGIITKLALYPNDLRSAICNNNILYFCCGNRNTSLLLRFSANKLHIQQLESTICAFPIKLTATKIGIRKCLNEEANLRRVPQIQWNSPFEIAKYILYYSYMRFPSIWMIPSIIANKKHYIRSTSSKV